jgi:hypothetical protein
MHKTVPRAVQENLLYGIKVPIWAFFRLNQTAKGRLSTIDFSVSFARNFFCVQK